MNYEIIQETLKIVKEVSLPIYVGILISNLSQKGMFEGLAQNSLNKAAAFLQLPRECAMAIMLSIGDRMAGMGLLMSARHKDLVTDQEVVATNLIAKLPSVVQFFIVSFIPIILNLFPRRIAIQFLVLYFLSFAIISLGGFLYLRFIHKKRVTEHYIQERPKKFNRSWSALKQGIMESVRPCLRTLSVLGIMTFVALLLSRSGALERLGTILPIDTSLLPIAMIGMLSMVAGIMAAGAQFQAGALDVHTVLPLLFAISILHNIYDLFAASLPRTFAVFGSSLGLKVGITSFVVTQTVMIMMMILVSFW